MRRLLVLALLVVSVMPAAGAVTSYDIDVAADGSALVNVSFALTSNEPVNYWETSWGVPAEASIMAVRDTQGSIEDYTRQGDQIAFETNRGDARTKELVTVVYRDPDVVSRSFDGGLSLVEMQLSGFDTEQTQVRVSTGKELLAESHPFGFRYSMDEHGVNYSGTGPVNLQFTMGPDGEQYDHYALFGDGSLAEADDLYWVVSAVTGFSPTVNKYPVVVLPDAEYDQTVDQWSAGQYRSGGLIFIRKSVLEEDAGAAVVLHEVTHAFNEHALRWWTADRAWFDEGVAKYVEWLVTEKKDVPQAEIFGDRVTWRCGQRQRCYYEPRGTPDDLWNYYQEDRSFMYSWSPQTASTAEQRVFGYAFSELVVRNVIRQQGADALHPVYNNLLAIDTRMKDSRAATNRILDYMNTDFAPCQYKSRDQFEQCLDTVNAMAAEIPDPVGPEAGEKVAIEPINRTQYQPEQGGAGEELVIEDLTNPETGRRAASNLFTFLSGLIDWMRSTVTQYLG